jgi:DnaJ family protein C protein 2
VPSAKTKPDQFFKVFGPLFVENSRFSEVRPKKGGIPQLGDMDSEYDEFYDFWYKFKSWREFTSLNEHTVGQARDREEKRWMEKGNRAKQAEAKKDEVARIRKLVDNCHACDPRIRATKDAAKKAVDDKKKVS